MVGSYLFYKGEEVGIKKYRHSKNMELVLKSAYHFGYTDAKQGRSENWENSGEE